MKKSFFLLAETSIHAGSGRDVGFVDLPIQRDITNEFPIIQPSGIKGSFRDFLNESNQNKDEPNPNKELINSIFGPEDGNDYSSCISFQEARTLLFPVKSLYGIYAYVTCPYVLARYFRDIDQNELSTLVSSFSLSDEEILTPPESILHRNNLGVLHDFLLQKSEMSRMDADLKILNHFESKLFPADSAYSYWTNNFKKRFAIVSDELFHHFVKYAVEIITRNKIGDNGVVDSKTGGLWTEENLPSETVLYSTIKTETPYKKVDQANTADEAAQFVMKNTKNKRIQFGGNKTIGRGCLYINFID